MTRLKDLAGFHLADLAEEQMLRQHQDRQQHQRRHNLNHQKYDDCPSEDLQSDHHLKRWGDPESQEKYASRHLRQPCRFHQRDL